MNKTVRELLTLHFLNDGVRTTFVILLPFIAKDLTINLATVGILGASQPLLGSLLALPTGFIAARAGGFNLLITLLIVYSLGALGIALSFNVWMIILAFTLGALGFGMFHTVGFSLVAKNSGENNIGRNMGDFTSIGEIGRVALPPLAVFSTSLIGWRITFVLVACLGFLAFIFFKLFTKPHESHEFSEKALAHETMREFGGHIKRLFQTRKFLLVTTTAILDSIASSPIYVFLPFLLLAKGLNPWQYGIATGAFFVGSLCGKTLLGRAVDRAGHMQVFIVSELAMAGMLLFLPSLFSFPLLLIASILLGIFTKGTSPVIQTLFSKMANKEHYNKVYAVSEFSIGMAAVVIILILGVVAQKFGISSIFYITAAFGILAVLPCIALIKQKLL